MKIIDPHLHFFDLTKGQYQWLKPDAAPFWPDKAKIARNFSHKDLLLPPDIELVGFVHIEAGFNNQQPWQEIAWLEQSNALPFKSIASIDLTVSQDDFNQTLNQLCQYSSVVGVRHILDDEASVLLTNQRVLANLAQLPSHNLLFEAQLQGSDNSGMRALTQLARHLPNLAIVLNHGGFCPNTGQLQQQWQRNIAELAACSNVYVKASGWEMVSRQYNQQDLIKTIAWLLHCFDQTKVMLASNFPLCLLSDSYANLWQSYAKLELSAAMLERLMLTNSLAVYRFELD